MEFWAGTKNFWVLPFGYDAYNSTCSKKFSNYGPPIDEKLIFGLRNGPHFSLQNFFWGTIFFRKKAVLIKICDIILITFYIQNGCHIWKINGYIKPTTALSNFDKKQNLHVYHDLF